MKGRSPLRLSWQNSRLDKLALVSVVLISELGRMEVDLWELYQRENTLRRDRVRDAAILG